MQKNFTASQLLRLAIQRYGELLGIEKFYERVKKYEWKIKNASDRSEKWQIVQLKKYHTGIESIEQGYCTKFEALQYIYKLHTRLTKQSKRKNTRKKK